MRRIAYACLLGLVSALAPTARVCAVNFWGVSAAARSAAPLRTPDSFVDHNRFLRTAALGVTINQSIWFYDRFIRANGEDPQFRVGWGSFVDNLSDGYEWDGNNFWTNHFLHPGQGTLHFTAARANGYGYWQAALWTGAGAWMWEVTGEVNKPSTNDLINQSFGGMVLGEPLFRLSSVVLDNQARGGERVWREVGGILISPVRGLNRLVTGEAFHVHRNPDDRLPSRGRYEFGLGARSQEGTAHTDGGFGRLSVRYGDAFDGGDASPFSYFDFDLVYNFGDPDRPFGEIKTSGILGGVVLGKVDASQHALGWFQHFDFRDNEAYEFGHQSVGAGYLGRFPTQTSLELRPAIHLNGILLGATRSDYINESHRTYDYGMGLGYEASLSISGRQGREYVTIGRNEYFIRSIDGNEADHVVAFNQLSLWLPILGSVAAGGDYIRYTADRNYRIQPDVFASHSELRVYLSYVTD